MVPTVLRLRDALLSQMEYEPGNPIKPRREVLIITRNQGMLLVKLLETMAKQAREIDTAHRFLVLQRRDRVSRLGTQEQP